MLAGEAGGIADVVGKLARDCLAEYSLFFLILTLLKR